MKPLETVTGVGTESEKLRNYTNVLHLKRGFEHGDTSQDHNGDNTYASP